MERLLNIHPGEVLREEFLKPMGITPYRLAKDIGVPATAIADIVHERRGITASMALRLARYFGTSAELWLGLQSDYDLEEAQNRLGETLQRIEPRARQAA